MTFSLTKAERRAKQAHIETLREAERNLQSVIDARRQVFNSRSSRWRDSVAGERVSEWIDNWEQYEPELVELSSELASDALDQLPYDPE